MLGCLLSAVAMAQPSNEVAADTSEAAVLAPYDAFQVRLRYGVSVRSGSQTDVGPGLTYSGVTPNDLALQGWGWLLLDGKLGGLVSLQREGLSLFDGSTQVTQGGLVRFALGPAGRIGFGPVRLEASAAYAFHQLLVFPDSGAPTFEAASRHAVLLAARGIVDLGRVEFEVRGEVPIALATRAPGGAAGSSGFGVGGGVRVNLFTMDSMRWGLLADVSYASDSVTSSGGLSSTQSLIRAGGAVDLQWRETEMPGPKLGAVVVTVADEAGGAPLSGATVRVGGAEARTDAQGRARLEGLPVGEQPVEASLSGYLPSTGTANVARRDEVTVGFRLEKEPPKVGDLELKVTSTEGTPLAKVQLTVGEKSLVTDEQGIAKLSGVEPGPIAVRAQLQGYLPAEEAASVAAGRTAKVEVVLRPAKKAVPATITGIVRSTAGGQAVAADLELPQLKQKAKATAQGAFAFTVPGGTYTVIISAPGFLSQTKSVTVKDGDQAIFNVDLHPR